MSRAADRLLTEAQKLHRKGQLDAARRRYDALLEQDPHHGEGRLYRALLLQNQGQIRDALGEARQAMADIADPEPALQMNYGVLLKNAGYVQEAEEAYRQALAKAPQSTAIKANLATVLMLMGRVREAEPMFWELTRVMEEPAPWLNLARLSLRREDWEQAREQLHAAEDLDPANPEVHLLRAQRFEKLQDHESAFGCLDAVFRRAPASREAWELVERLDPQALDIEQLGRWAQRLHASGAQSAVALTAAVNLCRRQLIWEVLPALERMLTEALQAGLDRVPQAHAVFTLLGARVPQSAHLVAAKAHWRALAQGASALPKRSLLPRGERKDRIRVAILSSDLRQHAGGTLMVGLLERLPRDHIEWYAYSNSFDDDSAFRERIRPAVDRFINTATLTDRELAEKIRSDDIDILIDYNGMTRETRVKALAYRPAPIQMTWLGMPGSVGAEGAIDYLIGDPWVTHAGNRDGFAESIVRLPRSYQPNDHQPPELDRDDGRADEGLPEDAPVLCCFNQHWKISPQTWALWCRILEQVPDAVLWLLAPQTEALAEQFRGHLREYGIDESRLVFAPKRQHARHLARLRHADLVLDTLPYNAHTTASDALRVGVPVLTLPGQTFAARVAAGILDTAGMPEWIAESEADYEAKAVAFVQQSREAIETEKQRVYEAYWASAMVDNAAMARQFEAMCLQLYDRHAAGAAPTDLGLNERYELEPIVLKDAVQDPVADSAEWNEGDEQRHAGLLAPQLEAGLESGPSPEPVVSSTVVSAKPSTSDGEREAGRSSVGGLADAMSPEPELILVLGSWSSGTTALTGFLAQLGAYACPPYLRLNDRRTPNSFEPKALRDQLRSYIDERSLQPRSLDRAGFRSWLEGWIAEQRELAIRSGYRHLVLKHPLTAFFIPEFREVCAPRMLVITRPLEAIERTRQRRQWPSYLGERGARVIYQLIYDQLAEQGASALMVSFDEFVQNPSLDGRLYHWVNLHPDGDTAAAAHSWVQPPEQRASHQ
ncbi:MAG: tetratricopeptide repeat protein [Halorhodospira sp.]